MHDQFLDRSGLVVDAEVSPVDSLVKVTSSEMHADSVIRRKYARYQHQQKILNLCRP